MTYLPVKISRLLIAIAIAVSCRAAVAEDPWADTIVNYDPGTDPAPGFTMASAALGSPTATSAAFGGYIVSPFSPPASTDELLSLGAGGEVIVRFDEPVMDDPDNPFGIDLIVFGNSFFSTSDFNFDDNTTVTGVAGEGGIIAISQNGVDFIEVTVEADGLYPTNGYSDVTEFFPATASDLADFTLPVDPDFDATGLGAAAVVAGYGGSGGGAGIDIGEFGLSSVMYVRVTNPEGSTTTPEIDAFADVRPIPEPETGIVWGALMLGCLVSRHVGRR